MTEFSEMRDEMDRVGELMAQLPTREWTSWVLVLLKVLDGQANERGEQYDYLEVLVRISGDIAMRLELGAWRS
jgi:hypothetical protein